MLIEQKIGMTLRERIAIDNSNNQFLQSLAFMPIGFVFWWAGKTIPKNFLECNGALLDKTEYPELFKAIGYAWGGEGDYFNLPDMRGKMPIGVDDRDKDFEQVGKTGGNKEVALKALNIPPHVHRIYIGEGSGNQLYRIASNGYTSATATYADTSRGENVNGQSIDGTPFNNMNPYAAGYFVIKAVQVPIEDDFRFLLDQTYTPDSANAQSGKAVAGAVAQANKHADKAVAEAKTLVFNNFANALKGTLSGTAVFANDVSSIEHELGVKISSKNLCDIPDITVEGTTAWRYLQNGSYLLPSGTYTISVDFEQQGEDIASVALSIRDYDNVAKIIKEMFDTNTSGRITVTFTIPETIRGILLCAYSNCTADKLTTKCSFTNFQLELGSTATEYTPYVDVTSVEVSRYGKNLFNINNYILSGSPEYQITANSLKGNFNWSHCIMYTISNLTPNTEYMFSCKANNTTSNLIYITDATGTNIAKYTLSFTLKAKSDGTATIAFRNSVNTYREYDIYDIQLEPGTTATDYGPYTEPQTVAANANGTVDGLTSVSPNMTLIPDTEGIIIDCDYNVDTKLYIDNGLAKIKAELSAAILNT